MPTRGKDHRVVEITQEIIDDSEVRNSSHCMIAEGIKYSIPGASFISVDIQTIRYTDKLKGERYVYLTPRAAQEAIIKFDQGLPQKPFTLNLRVPTVMKIGKNRKKKDDTPAKVVTSKGSKGAIGQVTRIESGTIPPRAPGNRRSFGLRGLSI